jgi:lipopolysaccharide/colanic/teichoic acid biosynthesis glycosyltransferase
MHSSILFSEIAPDPSGTDKDESSVCHGDGNGCAGSQRADSTAAGLQFYLGGGIYTDGSRTFDPYWRGISLWTRSAVKRVFDCGCVLLALPVLLPLLLLVCAAVRLTSRGPVFFRQKRAGMHGRTFTIFKFRTMEHIADRAHRPVTTLNNQRFTPVGPFLRRWKLDELPQLSNVFLGDMSLVGPRPRLPEHLLYKLPCRPGLTGAATVAFAREEVILADIPAELLDDYYRHVVLPAKHQIDAEYLAQATFFSDLGLLINTALRRWNTTVAETFLAAAAFERMSGDPQLRMMKRFAPVMKAPAPAPAKATHVAVAEQASAL